MERGAKRTDFSATGERAGGRPPRPRGSARPDWKQIGIVRNLARILLPSRGNLGYRAAMSMKRSKQRSSGGRPGDDEESSAWSKPAPPEPTWADIESKPAESFVPFQLSSRYAKGDLIAHPKFGKGLVLGVEGPRIEVLFQDGKKKLGHTVA
jgi:hypothetical protein